MPLLPAVVPDIPEDRARIVAARIARKIAPLFGVVWPDSPFGLTWVCDYPALTLAEIGRGAPLPPRSGGPVADRAVVAGPRRADGKPEKLPGELANATLQRFGPEAKAAVVLTGANRLLAPVTAAIGQAMTVLGPALPPRLRLAGWAGMVLEAFRSQPALFAAAIQARAIQRAMLEGWALPVPRTLSGRPFARCEIGATPGAGWVAGSPLSPVDLDVVDHTLPALDRPTGHDTLASQSLGWLAAFGTAHGDGYLWLSETSPGHRVVEAFVPQGQAVQSYLDAVLPARPPDRPPLPELPSLGVLTGLDVLGRRAVIIGLTAVIRQIRREPDVSADALAAAPAAMDSLAGLAEAGLGATDPVTLITRCRAADLRLETVQAESAQGLDGACAVLRQALDRCHRAHRARKLDRGTLAELVYAANVEINAVRRLTALQPAAAPDPVELNAWLRRSWTGWLALVDIAPGRLDAEDAAVAQQAGYHLSAFASYLAGQHDEDSLHTAARLFENAVLPARRRRHERTGVFQPLRESLQTASRATTTLAARAAAAGEIDQARRWAALGHRWIGAALAGPGVRELLASSSEIAARLALLAAPALLAAVEYSVPGAGLAEIDEASRLAAVAQRFAAQAAPDGQYARQPEIDAIIRHAAELRDRHERGVRHGLA
ncbi:hypothetical protein [Kutzneria buriramensis]|uniref:Uncharacterized protein n=1 Tax=Kutzneria buriramensis TaxID=1045776 RepID=A0A3E0HLX7_9PSEU|nr:hypothetical protein [Kutzneria buriramensis]REH47350.1 hypothetical protein BCF44_106515 [Kutzneria buriramensis]